MELVDQEILEASCRFEVLHTFRSFHLWGDQSLSKMDETMGQLKEFMRKTIELGEEHGDSDDTILYLAHLDSFGSMRGIKFTQLLEHYLVAVIHPDIVGRHSFSDYKDFCYTNTEMDDQTVKQLDNMTFKPLLQYMKKIDSQLGSLAGEWLEGARTISDHRRLEQVGSIKRECVALCDQLKRHELEWISDQKLQGKDTVVSHPWDFCFFSFCHFIDTVFVKAKQLKDQSVDYQMVHHYGRIASLKNRHPADRLRTLLSEIHWCERSYAF